MCVELIGRVRGLLIRYKINGWAQLVFLNMYFYLVINNVWTTTIHGFLLLYYFYGDGDVDDERAEQHSGCVLAPGSWSCRFKPREVQLVSSGLNTWLNTYSVSTGYRTLKTTLTEECAALYGDRATSIPTLAPIRIIPLKTLDQLNKRVWRLERNIMNAWRW